MTRPAAVVLLLAACTRTEPPAAGDPGAAAQLFESRCAPCHGRAGSGDGPAAASLRPRPRDFHDKSWQAGVTDEHIERIIRLGGNAVGKSASMPGNPDLTPPVITGLKDLIRSYGR